MLSKATMYFGFRAPFIATSSTTLLLSAVLVCAQVPAFGGSPMVLSDTAQERVDYFALYFKSNREEMRNVPIYFSKQLPSWLKGILVRNGLGIFENGDRSFVHAFDGFAKLASWQFFGNNSAVFSTRFIRSRFYKDSMKSKSIAPFLLFETVSPPFDVYERLKCLVRGIDNMNINVYEFTSPKTKRKEYAALSDYWIMYKISILKLSTKSQIVPRVKRRGKKHAPDLSDIGSMGFLNLLSSAHPLPEFGKNNHFTYLASVAVLPWETNRLSLVRIKSLKRRRIVAQWSVDRVPYMHSFSVTQTKAILLASPFYVNVTCIVIYAEPFTCLDWYADKPSTLYVITLKTKRVDTIQIPNVFTMHHVNAYDDSDGNIVMDISSYRNPDFVKLLQLDILRDPVKRNKFDNRAKLKRITINMTSKTAAMVDIDSRPNPGIASTLDLPVINEAYRSQHYCFVYGVAVRIDNVTLGNVAIVKKDVCHAGSGDRVWHVPRQYPAEPWFVARPGAVEEDDGILFVPVFRGAEQASYLVMLDAKDFSVINEAEVPTRIPYSLHGRFFPD